MAQQPATELPGLTLIDPGGIPPGGSRGTATTSQLAASHAHSHVG